MSHITGWALGNRRLVAFAVVAIVMVGPISFLGHPSREDPAITIRTAVVSASYPGMSAQRVESLITRKLEEHVRTMPEVAHIVSTSRPGSSTLKVELHNRYDDLQPIWQKLRNLMQDAQQDLPEGTRGPVVNDEYGAVAMATIGVTATGFSRAELQASARTLRDALYGVDGVARVTLHGMEPERIYVDFDAPRLARLGVSAQQLAVALSETNTVAAGGRVRAAGQEFSVEPTGNFEQLDDLARVSVPVPGAAGQFAYLGDLASIRRGFTEPPTHPVLVNGESAVILAVEMIEQFDAEAFGSTLRHAVADLEQDLPIGYQLTFVTFQPAEVQAAIGGVMSNLYQTVAIVLVVVMLFLGWRTGLIVGVMVPLTMLATVLIMRVAGIELERMSLATLIIALGLLIDNGIVVAEEIGGRVAAGEDRLGAALAVGRLLAVPLLAASLTTIFAFLPLMLAEHEAGEYTRSLSLVIAISLLSSWVLALSVTPLACVYAMPKSAPREAAPSLFERAYPGYRRGLAWLLQHKGHFLILIALLLAAAGWGFRYVPKTFFPASDRGQLQVYVDLPAGTSSERTLEVAERLSGWLAGAEASGVESHVIYVADGGPRFYLGLSPIEPDPHRAFAIVNTTGADANRAVAMAISAYAARALPEARVTVKPMSMGSSEAGLLEYRIVGPDANTLLALAEDLQQRLRDFPGTANVQHDWENRIVKLQADIRQDAARAGGLTSESVAFALNTTLSGTPVSDYREDDQLVPIVIRADDEQRASIDRLRTLNVNPGGDPPIPLMQVAQIGGEVGFARIQRRDQARTVTISVRHPSLSAAALDERLQPALAALTLPRGYRLETGGEPESSAEARGALFAGLPLAATLIVLVLISQFNSFRRTAITLAVIPLTLIGITAALLAMPGAQFSFMAILGVLSLGGIIINNAIVLIDRIEIERAGGAPLQTAVLDAATARLRPIVMTTITTVLGLLPLVWSRDVLFYDLAVVLMGGLLVGTVLTLGMVPVLYVLCFGRLAYNGADERGGYPLGQARPLHHPH